MPPGGVDRNGNLELCSKSLPVFKQFKAMKSSGEKERWTWTASNPFLPVRPLPFLLTHLSQTVTRDTHFPLYSFPSVPPDGKVGWWKGLGDRGIRISPAPLSVCPCAQGWPCVPGCTHKRQGVFLWPPQMPHLAASLSFPLCPSAPDSSLTPHSCSLTQKQPLVCPPPLRSIQLAALRVSRVACASFSGSSVLPGATWPGVPLSHQATWVTSVNLLRPSLLLPGALSCSPVRHLCSQSPSPSLWRLVPSTPLDLTGTVAQLLISSHCTRQPAQGFL